MSGRRRILIVECNNDGTIGGSHQAMFDLLCGLDRAEYEPVALFYEQNVFADRLRAEGVEVVLFETERAAEVRFFSNASRVARLLGYVQAIRRRTVLLRKLRIDLVQMNNSPSLGCDDWLPAARLAGIPAIANVMGGPSAEHGIRRWLYHRFDRILTISRLTTAMAVEHGFSRARIVENQLGVDLPRFRARVKRPRDEVRASLGVPLDSVVICMVGNIRRWKGQNVLLEALAQVPLALRVGVHAIFAGQVGPGDAPYAAELEALAELHGLTEHVHFLGGRDDVPDLLAASDIAVHASTTAEPFGLVVPEAMSLGLAVCGTSIGGPAEVIMPGTGLLHDPADPSQLAAALTTLLADPSERRRIGDGALVRVEEFSTERYVARCQAVYAELLGAR